MIDDKVIERTAKTLETDVDTLKAKADVVYEAQGAALRAGGKSDEEAYAACLKIAGVQIRNETRALRNSGATQIHGMFISVPRAKQWGKNIYNKNKNELLSADEGTRMAKVDMGAVVLLKENADGSFTRYAREDFFGAEETTVTELPRHSMRLDGDTHFYCVWDKSNPTFANGNNNFKFGQPRPQDDRERVSLFVGSEDKTGDWRVMAIRGSGGAADVQWPTFTCGSLAVGIGQNKGVGYLKAKLLDFTPDDSIASMFPDGPMAVLSDERMAEQEVAPLSLMESMMDLPKWSEDMADNPKRWDAVAAVQAEIIHIDPRNNGASTLICADLDVNSSASVVEVYSPAERVIDFGVGTKILLVGSTWKDKQTGEQRMGVSGWWPFDEVSTVSLESEDVMDDGELGEW
tara:strand:- start:127 stop:1338 length:1212 start_codon:yes stop_codon:yes gene_type:complete